VPERHGNEESITAHQKISTSHDQHREIPLHQLAILKYVSLNLPDQITTSHQTMSTSPTCLPPLLNSSILQLKTHPYLTLLTLSLLLVMILHFTTMSLFTHINKILYPSDSDIHRQNTDEKDGEEEQRRLRNWAYPSSSSGSGSGWGKKREVAGGFGKEGVKRSWTG
jgi:hypothetical protein